MEFEDNLNKLFQKYFPEGRIEWIAYSDLPEKAIRRFEGMSERFILPKDYREGDFTGLFVVHHNDGMRTYLARQLKNYSIEDETPYIEELVYLYEMNGDIVIGNGELRYAPEKEMDFFKDKPFVGFTETEEEFRKRGFAIRRLVLMNALSQLFFRLPLNSNERSMHPGGMKAWKHLVREGKAKAYRQDKRRPMDVYLKKKPMWCTRYVFV